MSEPNSKLFRDDPATYYAELGAKAERERIIKLLSTHLRYADWEGIFWEPETTGKTHSVDVEDIIALIKGEANE